MAPTALAATPPMTFDLFLEFCDGRPDGETWELVDGMPVMSPQAADIHQLIVANIVAHLLNHAEATDADWLPLPGHAVPIPGDPVVNAPVPDALVCRGLTGLSYTAQPLVVFEVLSRSNRRADRAWRAKVYGLVPSITAYVTISQTARRCELHTRDSGWVPRLIEDADAAIPLPALGLDLPLARLYRHTPLAAPA